MKTIYPFLLIALFALYGCGSTKSATVEDIAALRNLVENQHFTIESDWAQPTASIALMDLSSAGLLGPGNSSSNINLQGNSNFLKIEGDSITSYLPFYGERHMGAGYGGRDNTIAFDGEMQDYEAVWNDAKQRYNITFKAKSHNEKFDVMITLFPNNSSTIVLTSSSRSAMRYTGKVEALDDAK